MVFLDNCVEDDILCFVLWIIVVISSLLCVFIVLVNMLICIVIIKDFFKDLWMLFNYFIINLVVVDLVIGFVILFSFIIYYFWEVIEGKKLSWIWVFYLMYFMLFIVLFLSLLVLVVDCCCIVMLILCRRFKLIYGYLIFVLIWCLLLIFLFIYF